MIVAGAAYGLFRGRRAVAKPEAQSARLNSLTVRLEALERAVGRDGFVTSPEMAEAIDRATARLSAGLDRKFEAQSRAVGSLRAMISQNDILLQRVLDGLERARSEAQPAGGAGW